MSHTNRALLKQVFRAITVVVFGACAVVGITKILHAPYNPYYAQLAAKAATTNEKTTGDEYAYDGNDSK